MLSKQNRITQNRDFLKIFKTVRPLHTAHFAIRIAKRDLGTKEQMNKRRNEPLDIDQSSISNNQNNKLLATRYSLPPRFGFVISNKIDKRSSRRNGLKRRIRAVIEGRMTEFPQNINVVIQVKKPFDYPYDFSVIEGEVMEGLKKAGAKI